MQKYSILVLLLVLGFNGLSEENKYLALHKQLEAGYRKLQNVLHRVDSQQTFDQNKVELSKIDGEIKTIHQQINSYKNVTDEDRMAVSELGAEMDKTNMTIYGELAFLCFDQNKVFQQVERVIPHYRKIMDRQISSYKKKQINCPEEQIRDFLIAFCLWGNGNPERFGAVLKRYQVTKDDLDTLLFHLIWLYSVNNQTGDLPPQSNWYKIIKLLLENGADVNGRNEFKDTPLLFAINNGNGNNLELVNLLIAKGADVNARTRGGMLIYDAIPSRIKHTKYHEALKKAGAKSDKLTEKEVAELKKVIQSGDGNKILSEALPVLKLCSANDRKWAADACYKLFDHKDDLVKVNAVKQFLNLKESLSPEEKDRIRETLMHLMKSRDKIALDQTEKLVNHMNEQMLWNLEFYREYKKGSAYDAKSITAAFKIPDLGTERLSIAEKEMNRRTTTEIRMVGDNGNAAVVIMTRIRKDLPKGENLLDRVATRIASDDTDRKRTNLRDLDDKEGQRYLEALTKNLVYDDYFPYGQAFDRKAKTLVSCGGSLFYVRKGYLVEVAIFLKNSGNLDEKGLFKKVRDRLMTLKNDLEI